VSTGFSLSVLSGSNYSVIGNTITPVTNFSGTLTVRVFVNDGQANSTIYNLQIQVNTVNDPPVITGQVALSTNEDTPITIQLANLTVTDPDNNFPADFTLGILSGTNYTFSGTTVTPAANFNGTLTVRVTVNDGQTSSAPFNLQITVNAVNDAPVITGQLPLNTNEDTSIALQLLYLTVTDVDNTYPSGFTLTVLSGTNYTFSGTTVTPATNFNGTLSVSVRVNDGAANSAPFNLQITVTAVNDSPVITGQVPLSTGEDSPITVQLAHLTVADPDNSYPTGFSLIVLPGTNYTVSGAVVTPALDFIGTLTVPVRVNDGTVDSAPFNLQITVSGDNDTPVIVGQVALSTNEDTPLTIKLSDLVVTDPDDPYPTEFTLAILSGTNYTFSGATITPAPNFNGTLTVRVTVNDGTTNSAPFNLQVQVNPVNDPPVITGQGTLSTNEAQAITIKFSDLTVTDPDNAYPSGFTLTILSGANYTFSGTTVTPTGAFAGDLFVNVRVNDGASNSNTFQLLITVNGVNDPPTSSGFAPVALQEDDLTDKTVNLLTVFNDQENTPDQLTYTITGNDNPSYFQTITINQALGQLVFRMKANVFGTAKVTVRATDGGGLFVQDVLTINITAVNDAPLFDATPTWRF
ncbi:MAG: tandem-95 repeat protein, partial [Bacteroidia bacterium]|nr:tandem-95 repeat protein [Bacteroidia bacterium]